MNRVMKLCLWVLPGLLLLGLAIRAAWTGWTSVGDTEMSWHGIAALLLGGVFTLGLTALLVGLLLYSRRNGYDDR